MTQPIEGTGQSAGVGGQSATTTDGTATGTGTGPATGQSTGTETQSQTPPATVTQAEFDALKRQLQAADQNRAKAEADAKALRDAQLSEEDKRKQDLEAAQKQLAQREQELRTAQIQNAFLTDNSFDWHDPKAALRLADLSAVTVEGDKVTGLKEALKAVADAFPFMVKPKADSGDGGTDANAPSGGATGVTGQGQAAGRAGNNSAADMAKRFPALRGRVS